MKVKPGSMGKPAPGYKVAIVDDNGNLISCIIIWLEILIDLLELIFRSVFYIFALRLHFIIN